MWDLPRSARTRAWLCWGVLGLLIHVEASAVELRFDGVLRHRFEQMDDFAVDAEGLEHGQTTRGLLRFHASTQLKFSRSFYIRSTLQFFDGQVLGKQSDIDGGPRSDGWRHVPFLDQVLLREAVVHLPIGLGNATVGRMPVHWGMGLVSHNGVTQSDPFNDPDGGDIINGAWVDLKPLLPFTRSRVGQAIRLVGGAGILEQDELTDRRDGDFGIWAASALKWHEPAFKAGVYGSYRHIRRHSEERLMHYVLDVTWWWRAHSSDALGVIWSGEAAYIGGETSLLDAESERQHTGVAQLGGATRLEIQDREHGLGYTLEAGYASGDNDPNDNIDQRFLMDPARGIGTILFEEILARTSAQRYAVWREGLGEDEEHERPELLPTKGAVHNAVYIAPRVTLELCEGCVQFAAGGLVAFAAVPLKTSTDTADSVNEANPYGGKASAAILGYEANAGARMGFRFDKEHSVMVGAQWALFVPGPALRPASDAAGLGTVQKLRLTADVTW